MEVNLELLQTACDQAVEGFALHDAEGAFVYVNPAQAAMYGYTPEELLGQSWQILYSGSELEKLETEYMPTLAKERHWQGELKGLKKDGSTFDVGLSLRLISEPEPGLVCNCRDISETKQTEQKLRQLQRLDSLGKMTGGVAHDLNNILLIQTGSLDLAAQYVHDPEAIKYLKTASNAADQAESLCKRLLAFSSQQDLHPISVNLSELMGRVRLALDVALNSEITLTIDCPEDLRECFVDAIELENAIVNLALNARDAMPEGGDLSITASNTNDDGTPKLSIAVKDTGSGMTPDLLDKIFDPFFTTKPRGKGTGLGLSIVYGFVKQSGGSVKAASTPNEGTEFTLALPVAE